MTDLAPPATYQGGKVRLASKICDIIGDPGRRFFDLCCGSGAVAIEMRRRGFQADRIVMVDAGPWAIFYAAVADGSLDPLRFRQFAKAQIPDQAGARDWCAARASETPDHAMIPYLFPLMQAAAFGGAALGMDDAGRWAPGGGWRSYWTPTATSNRRSPVNSMMPLPDTIADRVDALCLAMRGAVVLRCDVADLAPEAGSTAYLDVPYLGSQGYAGTAISRPDPKVIGPAWARADALCFASESFPMALNAHFLAGPRAKGGMVGGSGTQQAEWLTVYGRRALGDCP